MTVTEQDLESVERMLDICRKTGIPIDDVDIHDHDTVRSLLYSRILHSSEECSNF